MKRMLSLSRLFLILFHTTLIHAQSDGKVGLDFESKVSDWLAENKVPVAGVGIVEEGKIKYVKVFGDRRADVHVPSNTIFNIASMTKPVVAMLTLKLVESGQWSLDEPLSRYWIDPDVAGDPLLRKLTSRHVLSHQTGFSNWRGSNKLAFNFEPGTKFQYSGEGFEYLKAALEKKFNLPVERLLDSLLFKPLGMKDTRYWDEHVDMQRFARWHDAQGNEYKMSYQTRVSAADDLLTTVEDYCKFMLYVIDGAKLSQSLYNDMVRSQVTVKEHTSRGLGWEIVRDLPNGEFALAHGGGDAGVKTIGIMLPKSKRGIVIFTNGDNGTSVSDNIIKEAIDIGETILDFSNGAHVAKIIKLKDDILDRYIGTYLRSDVNSKIVVIREGNELKISGDGLPTMILVPESENKFFVKGLAYQYEFRKDEKNQVMKLNILESGKLLLDAKRIM